MSLHAGRYGRSLIEAQPTPDGTLPLARVWYQPSLFAQTPFRCSAIVLCQRYHSRTQLITQRQYDPGDSSTLVLHGSPVHHKPFESHIWSRAELQVETDGLSCLECTFDSRFVIPAQRPRAVVREELEDVGADSLSVVR